MRSVARRPVLATVSAAALVLVISGCGGSSGGGAEPADPIKTFQASANGICKTAYGKIVDATQVVKDPKNPTHAELAAIIGTLISVVVAQHGDLTALTAPAGLDAGYQKLLGSIQDVIGVAKADGTKFLTLRSSPYVEVDADARAIGLTSCAF